jgi:hypothetical protein
VVSLTNVIVGAGYVSIAYACTLGGWATIGVLWLLGAVFCYTGARRVCRVPGMRRALCMPAQLMRAR